MKRIRIASHNTFWFQGMPFSTDRPLDPDASILGRLCQIYRTFGADILCLQEIQSRETFRFLTENMHMSGSYCQGIAFPQYGGAVLWRQGRLVTDSHTSANQTQRMWQIVEVKIGARCVSVCNIHLPSERQLGPERASRQRLAELAVVLERTPPPDIVAGDFNESPGGDSSKYMLEHGYSDTALLKNKATVPTNLGKGRGDYIWVHQDLCNHIAEYEVLGKDECAITDTDKQYLSDHLPLWITLETE